MELQFKIGETVLLNKGTSNEIQAIIAWFSPSQVYVTVYIERFGEKKKIETYTDKLSKL